MSRPPDKPPPWARVPPHAPPFRPDTPHNAPWAILYYGHYWTAGVLTVYLTTDVACNLTLCQTAQPQVKHLRTTVARGLRKMANPKYCFVEYALISQNEPGDTLDHSFTWPGWSSGDERYWRFHAQMGGMDVEPNSATFWARGFEQEGAFTMKHTDLTNKEIGVEIDHADGSIGPHKLWQPVVFPLFPLTPDHAPAADYEVANKKYVDDVPAGLTFHWDDSQTVIFVANNVTASMGWLTIDLNAWCGDQVQLVHLQFIMGVVEMGVNASASVMVRKLNTTRPYNPEAKAAHNEGDLPGCAKRPSVVCGTRSGRYIQRQVTITGACKVNVGIILQGWWD